MSKWWFSGVMSRSGGCVAHGFAGLEADVLVDLDPIAQLGGHVIDILTIGLMPVQPEMTKSRPRPVRIPPSDTPMQTPPRKIKTAMTSMAMMIGRLKNRAFINSIRLQALPVVPLVLSRTEPLWPSYRA